MVTQEIAALLGKVWPDIQFDDVARVTHHVSLVLVGVIILTSIRRVLRGATRVRALLRHLISFLKDLPGTACDQPESRRLPHAARPGAAYGGPYYDSPLSSGPDPRRTGHLLALHHHPAAHVLPTHPNSTLRRRLRQSLHDHPRIRRLRLALRLFVPHFRDRIDIRAMGGR